jgi:hypothetical protein
MHMVEVRSRKWRKQYGLSGVEAERRVDEAARIIRSMGSLQLLTTWLDGGHFRGTFKGARIAQSGPQFGAYSFQPDYIGFLGFAYNALEYVKQHHPDAEKVDFVIERKDGVSHHMPNYLKILEDKLTEMGEVDLVRLIGGFSTCGKERVPLQAADVAMWHIRRARTQTADREDWRRLRIMFDERTHTFNQVAPEAVDSIAERAAKRFAKRAAAEAS